MTEQQYKAYKTDDADHVDELEPIPPTRTKDQELADHTDELLDEIDDVLEENAQKFVAEFVQAQGE